MSVPSPPSTLSALSLPAIRSLPDPPWTSVVVHVATYAALKAGPL
jgi:hypothetical protein